MDKKQKTYFVIASLMLLTGFIFFWNVWRNPDFSVPWNHNAIAYFFYFIYIVVTVYFFVKASRTK